MLAIAATSIFELYLTNIQVLKYRNRTYLILIFLLLCQGISWSQVMWPGDINNNGIVSNVDVLFWAIAKDATGPARTDASTTWQEENISELWGITFPNGVDFAYADCDGDGLIDDPDLEVIESNIDQTRPDFTPDAFDNGNPDNDPILLLETDVTMITGGQTVDIEVFLGDEAHPINNFYGVAFKLKYNPDLVGDQGNDVRFNISDDTWVGTQIGANAPIKFITNDPETGIAQIAIVRKNQETVDSFGILGTFSIVMEDIVVGIADDLEVEATDIKLVDLETDETLVAPSQVNIPVEGNMTATRERDKTNIDLNIFPNPTNGLVWITGQQTDLSIEKLELYDLFGRQVLTKQVDVPGAVSLDLTQQLPGMYVLKVFTAKGIGSLSIYR